MYVGFEMFLGRIFLKIDLLYSYFCIAILLYNILKEGNTNLLKTAIVKHFYDIRVDLFLMYIDCRRISMRYKNADCTEYI